MLICEKIIVIVIILVSNKRPILLLLFTYKTEKRDCIKKQKAQIEKPA